MAWADSLLDCTLSGLPLDVLATDDSADFSLAEHSYPYRDGSEVERLGRNTRPGTLKVILFGDDYETRLQDLLHLIERQDKALELVHPVFGTLSVCIRRYTVRHDADNVDCCYVDLEWIEAGLDNPFFDRVVPVTAADGVGLSFMKALLSGLSAVASMINKIAAFIRNPFGIMTLIGKVVGTLLSVGWAFSNLLKAPGALFNQLRGFVDDLAGLGGLFSAKESRSSGLPALGGQWQASGGAWPLVPATAEQVMQDYARANATLPLLTLDGRAVALGFDQSPAGRSVKNSASVLSGAGAAGPGQNGVASARVSDTGRALPPVAVDAVPATARAPWPVTDVAAQVVGLVMLVVNMLAVRALAEHAAIRLADESNVPRLSPRQVEALVGNIRARIQLVTEQLEAALPAWTAHPIVEQWRAAALQMQDMGQAVLDLRPPLHRRTVESDCSLHWLAHHWYGDMNRADELLRLNPQIRCPNFLTAGDVLNAYAK